MGRTKTIAKRIGKRPEPSGSTDQCETRELELDGAGSRTFADDDVELVVLHSWIEYFLDHFVQTVDLVDEEDVAVFQVGEDRAEVADLFNGWTGCVFDTGGHCSRNDVSECGLAEAGWAIEENVVDIFGAFFGGLNTNIQVSFDLVLANVFVKSLRT